MKNNIFKGVAPYTEEDVKIFKGRNIEAKALEYIVIHNDFSVCYAESGEGKTSLINAGLIPMLRKEKMFPVHIIFNDNDFNIDNPSADYFDNIVFAKISDTISLTRIANPNNRENTTGKLWKYKDLEWTSTNTSKTLGERLRTEFITDGEEKLFPILIFDQFEEVFTRPQNNSWTNAFFQWLEQLYNDCKPKDLGDTEANRFKVLVSLRSDYLCELDYWSMTKFFIPSFKNNRYCLKPLTKDGAYNVAKSLPETFLNGFSYDDIIEFAKIEKAGDINQEGYDLPCVSALMLGIILSSLERGLDKNLIQSSFSNIVDNKKVLLNTILEEYYETAMTQCDISQNEKERIEASLIDTKGQRRRIPLHGKDVEGINKAKLKELANRRIVNIINDEIEVSHDCLKAIIDKHNKERLTKTENKLFILWEFAIFAFICIGCFFFITYMWGSAAKHIETFKIGLLNGIDKTPDVLTTLILTISLLPLPFVAFLRFNKSLNRNKKIPKYPIFVAITGCLAIFHFIDFTIFEDIFKISYDLLKASCYAYAIVLIALIAFIYIPNIKIFPERTSNDSIGNHLISWCELPSTNILWTIFFTTLAAMLQTNTGIIGGQWTLICMLLCLSCICLINALPTSKRTKSIYQFAAFALIFYGGYSFHIATSPYNTSTLFYIFVLLMPMIVGLFCKKAIIEKFKIVTLFLCANLLLFYILTQFINPIIFIKGYNVTYIGNEGYFCVGKKGKEYVYTKNGKQVFDFEFDKKSISKYSENIKSPICIYKIPIKNAQKSLFEDNIAMLPFSVSSTNDSINIYRNPDFYGRFDAFKKSGTKEEKIACDLCIDLIKFMTHNTNEPICENRIPKISELYVSLEDSLKKHSDIKDFHDIIRLQQIMTDYIYTSIIRDAIRDNRKADAMKLLTLLSYSYLGNTPVYKGLNINCNINAGFSTTDTKYLFSSIKTIKSVTLSHEMMRSHENSVVDCFWYNNFMASLMITSKIITKYSYIEISKVLPKERSVSKPTKDLMNELEKSFASSHEDITRLKKGLEVLTNNDKSYLVKALINCTNQIVVLLKQDAKQTKHDWRSLLEYRFLVNLYNVLPAHYIISKSKNEIFDQDDKLRKNFNEEAEMSVKDIQELIAKYKNNLKDLEEAYISMKEFLDKNPHK